MGSPSWLRRAIGAVAAAALVSTGVSLVAATPASASATSTISATTWAYVDSTAPHTTFVRPAGDMPVGAHVDSAGVTHSTKSYVTFDLSAYQKTDILSANLFAGETSVTDCTTPRETQVWQTDTDTAPTWADQPAENLQLTFGGAQFGCPAPGMGWDAAPAIRQAVADGKKRVTFVFRMPDAQQADPAFGRDYDPAVRITVTNDKAPLKPTQLTMNNIACTSHPLLVTSELGRINLAAVLDDPDDNSFTAQFVWWPIAQPDQRTEIDAPAFPKDPAGTSLLQSQLADGGSYAWQVRGVDRTDTGPWSAVCRFDTDFTPPATAPTVTSTDYPPTGAHGGTGVPGSFTFNANGDKDVSSFVYEDNIGVINIVPADHRGGTATIQYAPKFPAGGRLEVRNMDAAGNVSAAVTDYDFLVASDAPKITCTPTSGFVGVPRTCVFTPTGPAAVVSYTYIFAERGTATVPTDSDSSATITITPNSVDANNPLLTVTGNLSFGTKTDVQALELPVDPGTPIVVQTPDQPFVGQPIQFTFQPGIPDVASYTYDWQGNQVTVPAGPDGTASVMLTSANDFAELDVFSTTTSGVVTGTDSEFVSLQSNGPTVTSADYPADTPAGGVGDPGTFQFSSPVPGAVSYTYSFNGGPTVTVPADADGNAGVVFTPTTPNDNSVVVTSTFADGSASESTEYDFVVNGAA